MKKKKNDKIIQKKHLNILIFLVKIMVIFFFMLDIRKKKLNFNFLNIIN